MYSQIKMISESSPRPSPALICLPGTGSSGRDHREAQVKVAVRSRLSTEEGGSVNLRGGRGLVPWCRCATRRAAFDQYCVERLFCISQTGRGARDALRVSCVNAGDRRGCVKEAEEEWDEEVVVVGGEVQKRLSTWLWERVYKGVREDWGRTGTNAPLAGRLADVSNLIPLRYRIICAAIRRMIRSGLLAFNPFNKRRSYSEAGSRSSLFFYTILPTAQTGTAVQWPRDALRTSSVGSRTLCGSGAGDEKGASGGTHNMERRERGRVSWREKH